MCIAIPYPLADKYTTYHTIYRDNRRACVGWKCGGCAALDTTSSSYTAAWEAAFDATGLLFVRLYTTIRLAPDHVDRRV